MRKLKGTETTAIFAGSALVLVNILLMWLLTYTPVPYYTLLLFVLPIVGVLAFAGLLWLGNFLAIRGIMSDRNGMAVAGVAVLQLTYGAFGSAVLAAFAPETWLTGILIAGGITALMTGLIALYVYTSEKDFSSWGRYATWIFIAAIVSALIGTFFMPFLLVTFLLTFVGFIIYLVFEIWKAKTHPHATFLNAVGLYVAVMGVFLHILQIVLRVLSRRR